MFDRASSAALKSDPKTGEVLEWNPVFADVTQRMGLGVDLCWPGRPNQKGVVESLVGWVKARSSRSGGSGTGPTSRRSWRDMFSSAAGQYAGPLLSARKGSARNGMPATPSGES